MKNSVNRPTLPAELSALSLRSYFIRQTLMPLCFMLLSGCFGFLGLAAYVYESARGEYIPYVVTVDAQGAILAREELKPSEQVSERLIAWALTDFIQNLYSRSLDDAVQLEKVQKVYAMLQEGTSAYETISSYYRQEGVMQQNPVQVEVTLVKEVPKSKTFIIGFKKRFLNSGIVRYEQNTVSYQICRVDTRNFALLKKNPLGLMITRIETSNFAQDEQEGKAHG
ncbi:MAG: type IV secretion system protein [Succinivibrio sp.]|nr:type IV secretion system protein [Succinivibrio sp.]